MHETRQTSLHAAQGNRRSRASRFILGAIVVLITSFAVRAPRRAVRGVARQLRLGNAGRAGELILPAAAHESADVGPRFIARAFGLLLISLIIVALGVLWLFPLPVTDRTLNGPLPLYPEPRLQPSPRQDMQRFLAAQYAQLTTYGWVDKAHQVTHIPIDVAMSRIAQSGFQDWPGSATAGSHGSTVAAGAAQ